MVPCSFRRVSGVLVLALVGAAGPAFAAPKVAALVPTLRPSGAAELRDKFQDAVTRGIADGGVDAIPTGEVRMRLAGTDAFTCSGAGPCAQKAATTLRADHTVASELVIAGKDYTIRLKLLDGTGKEVAHTEDTCDICTVKEADEALARATAKLISSNKAAMESGATTMVSPPPPRPAPPPVVTPPPHVETPPPAATNPPPPAAVLTTPPPVKEKKPIPWRGLAIGSLALGVVGIAIGAPLIAIDGQPTCSAPAGMDPKKFCKNVYNTAGGGGTMLAVGIVGLAGAGVLFYFDYRSRHQHPTTVSLVPLLEGGALATVGTRF
jgi:hypothetical protein